MSLILEVINKKKKLKSTNNEPHHKYFLKPFLASSDQDNDWTRKQK